MSALGQKRTWRGVRPMSALPPKADIGKHPRNVRFVPKADIPCSQGVKTLAAGTELIISSLRRDSGHGSHLLTRGNEVRVLVCDVFVSLQACHIGKLTFPNHIGVIRILRLARTATASQHTTACDAIFFQHIAS